MLNQETKLLLVLQKTTQCFKFCSHFLLHCAEEDHCFFTSCLGPCAPPSPVWASWHPLQSRRIVGKVRASEGHGSEERRSLILPSTWHRLMGQTCYRLACSANLYDSRTLAKHINGGETPRRL